MNMPRYPNFLFNSLISEYVSRDGEIDDLALWQVDDLLKLAKLCKEEAKRRASPTSGATDG